MSVSSANFSSRTRHRGGEVGFVHRAVSEVIAAANDAVAGDINKADGLDVARLKSHRGAGGDIQPPAVGFGSIELQRRVGFDEVVVAADLDWAIAEVGDREFDRCAAGVQFKVAK